MKPGDCDAGAGGGGRRVGGEPVDHGLALPGSASTAPREGPQMHRLGRTAGGPRSPGFTCATVGEMEGMAAAGLGHDLLLANEVVDSVGSAISFDRGPG